MHLQLDGSFTKALSDNKKMVLISISAQAWDGLTVVYGFDNLAFIYGMMLKY